MDTKTVKLKYPLERKGEAPISELTFREPRGKDLKRMDKVDGGITKTMTLAVAICEQGITPEEVDELCAADITAIGDEIENFMNPDGQQSGRS